MEIILAVYISQLIHFERVCSYNSDVNTRNQFLTANLLKQGYQYHKICKAFSKLYHEHSNSIVFCTIGLKTKLFCNTAYLSQYLMMIKFINQKRIVGKNDFSGQLNRKWNVIKS